MNSVFDTLYETLFGHTCSKEGEAFERIVAVISKLAFPDADVAHDSSLRGHISRSLYQVDVLMEADGGKSFGEAKDYSIQNKKVGRPDLQKLAGALLEVDAQSGVVYSATGYTAPATKYAQGAPEILGKPISLLHVRPYCEKDGRGRIQTIVVTFFLALPDYEKARFTPIWSPKGQATLDEWLDTNGKQSVKWEMGLGELLDSQGVPILSIKDLTQRGFGGTMELAEGCFLLPAHYMRVEDVLVEILGIEYSVPFAHVTHTITIKGSGKPQILVRSEDGKINSVITDKQLKGMRFDEDGRVLFK